MIKKLFLVVFCVLISSKTLQADNYVIANYKTRFIEEKGGNPFQRQSPCSTFKIPLAIIGFQENYLLDNNAPECDYQTGYTNWIPIWEQSFTPFTWMQKSCVWYSQEIIAKPYGQERLQQFVDNFKYGNMDASGTNESYDYASSWLNSSLQISPREQINFLFKFLDRGYGATEKIYQQVKNIIPQEDLINGWVLHGKTGTSYFWNEDGSWDKRKQMGWYIGWIEKYRQKYVFAYAINEMETDPNLSAGLTAKQRIKEKLEAFILKWNL
ncbi:MAG: penicillin-binding transpeptidase domain-containing protein [Alphaproteobacteria bacterium]|nr:penicillin-binding transpeptidase domain-containing protein [Alphaproteobacteria bacterium]